MSKGSKSKLIPNLRFTEFKNDVEWKEANLGREDISTFVNEKASLDELKLETYISTENILPHYAGIVKSSRLPQNGSFTKFKEGDVLISNIRPYLKKVWHSSFEGAASNDVIVIRSSSEIDSDFLGCVLKNDSFINYVMNGAQGVKMPRGDKSLMQDYIVTFPIWKEQKKIADCISSLDELIIAENQKLEAVKLHKKGLMQQLFPIEGERAPNLRFREFTNSGHWERKTLGTMTKKVGSGITPLGGESNYKKKGRPFVRSQNVGWGAFLLEDVAFIDEETHNDSISTEIEFEDVLLNITGASIGRSAVATHELQGGNVNQHVCIIRTMKPVLNPFFLCQYLTSPAGQSQIDSFQAGGNRQGLNFAQIRSFSIPVPPRGEEQQKIVECLSSLDESIAEQSKKAEYLQVHKKGLMQQLFPKVSAIGV
ncbi:MAG: restriction endonuclease subunit S [Bacteroidota bacterium]